MTHSPGDVAMATSKAEGTGQPHPRSSECKDNDNIQKTRKKMKKNFIQPREITKETLENGKGFPFTYGCVKEVANGQALTLDCEKLKVGHEVFFGVKGEDGKPRVVAALCKGYQLETDFMEYDDVNGMVDCRCNPIYLGEDGNTYKWPEDIITSVYGNRKDAVEALEEMIEDDMA